MKMKVPKARITLDLERELLEWVSRYADTHGKSRNEAIGEAVELLRKTKEWEAMKWRPNS